MNFSDIINSILVLTVIMFIGFVISKLRIITNEGASIISNFIMKVTFPITIIISMQKEFSKELFKTSLILIGLSAVIYFVLIIAVLGWGKISKFNKNKTKIIQFLIIFGNVAFMGFPVASAIYGDMGIFYASCFNMLYNILMFTVGIIILNSDGGKFEVSKLLNPGAVASVIGFIFFITSFKLPYVIYRPLQWIGDMTIPLALLIVGYNLTKIKFRSLINEPLLWIYSIERLIVFPLIVLVILKAIGLNEHLLVIPVVLIATPAPLTAGVFAKTYGGDEEIANKGIVLTNFLAILTIPLIIYFM